MGLGHVSIIAEAITRANLTGRPLHATALLNMSACTHTMSTHPPMFHPVIMWGAVEEIIPFTQSLH